MNQLLCRLSARTKSTHVHFAIALGAALLVLTGCMSHYDMTLRNGDVIRSKNKPKLNDHGYYVYKDLAGKEREINAMRIRQIEPVRPGSQPARAF